jgi:hypothetical protein
MIRSDAGFSDLLAERFSAFPLRLAQANVGGQRLILKGPLALPEIGAQFSGAGAEVSASSAAKWDGKAFTISMGIGRNDLKFANEISAPFVYALAKIGSPSQFLALAQELKNSALPMSNNAFEITRTLQSERAAPELYVVQHPITFRRPNGRVCFLAAAYSLVPIPDKLLSCNLF